MTRKYRPKMRFREGDIISNQDGDIIHIKQRHSADEFVVVDVVAGESEVTHIDEISDFCHAAESLHIVRGERRGLHDA